jgi:hypothetical protein
MNIKMNKTFIYVKEVIKISSLTLKEQRIGQASIFIYNAQPIRPMLSA